MLETFIGSMEFKKLKFAVTWSPGTYKGVCLHLVFKLKVVNEGCVWAGGSTCLCPWQFPLLNCTTVWETASFNTGYVPVFWVKNKRKIILSRQNFLNKYAKERKTRVTLSHMWDMCIYYIDSHRGINSVGCKLPKEGKYPWKCSASKSIASNHDCLSSQRV